jgi:hypothetical protein
MMLNDLKLRPLLLLCLGTCLSSIGYADSVSPSYQWGRGLDLFSGNLNLGGYAHASLEQLASGNTHVTFNDVSLFISATPSDSIRFFSEIELENVLTTKNRSNLSAALRIERLYIDYLATDTITLRLGKWLTPFGRWNVVHAAPLVWTTTRPFMTDEHLFPNHSNGVMLSKKFDINDRNLDVSVYIDDSEHLDPRKDFVNFENAIGSRINMEITHQLQIGFSYLGFKRSDDHEARSHLFGADLFWKYQGYELQSEFSYRHTPNGRGSEKGFYAQGVAPLTEHFFAVGRYDYLDGTHRLGGMNQPQSTLHTVTTGLAWRPFVPLVMKAEYRFGDDHQNIAPSGFFTSIAVFF